MNGIAHYGNLGTALIWPLTQPYPTLRKHLIKYRFPRAILVVHPHLPALLFAGTISPVVQAQEKIDFTQKSPCRAHPKFLLQFVQTRHLSASIRLTETTPLQVDQYDAFIKASADDVVEQAPAYVFSKDSDFHEFLKSAEAQRIAPTLRVRRAPRSETAEHHAPKLPSRL